MRHVEGVQAGQVTDGLQLVDLVIGDPELLQGLRCSLEWQDRGH